MAGKTGNYSKLIIYDERKRYFYFWPQKNKPILDDELRNMGIGLLDQVRRGTQQIFGDVAVPLKKYSTTNPTTQHFKVAPVGSTPGENTNDFRVVGGEGLENPAVLYAHGFYIFLTEDVVYSQQMYPTDSVDLELQSDKTKTLSLIPDLTTPTGDRLDIVYIDFHFEESSAATGSDSGVYIDSSLKDARVGTETANRLRAVIDIRVWEDYLYTNFNGSPYTGSPKSINDQIFDDPSFLGGINAGSYDNPAETHYRVPIAAIYRKENDEVINSEVIVDLLDIYNKRVKTLDELSYMSTHGGYTETGVYQLGLTGFQDDLPNAKIDEGAYATGLNQGFGTEAFNTNSVSPRVLDSNGKFKTGSLLVGAETGIITYPVTAETGPEDLADGEIMSNEASIKSVYIGYDRNVTGIREYSDRLNINMQGITGTSVHFRRRGITGVAGFSIHNDSGVTGAYMSFVESVKDGVSQNFQVTDYKGRLGVNTFTPGWEDVDSSWTAALSSNPNIVVDINDSMRVRDKTFLDNDTFIGGDAYGKSWKIPSVLDQYHAAIFGFTGAPQDAGLTGVGSLIVRPGIAVVGDTGINTSNGAYTGVAGFYQCYDNQGKRMFTIGDLGPEFDRVVRQLYGTGIIPLWLSDRSLQYLDEWGSTATLQTGDTVSYTVTLNSNTKVSGTYVIPAGLSGKNAVDALSAQLEADINAVSTYEDVDAYTLVDTWDESRPLADRAKNQGRIIVKDKGNSIDGFITFTISRGVLPNIVVTWTRSKFYGANSNNPGSITGVYGGDTLSFKFAKLDLGEGADAWLFNGDVFFNGGLGGGKLDRVTFSPNVIFRDDVFVYGNFVADSLLFNFAKVSSINIGTKLEVEGLSFMNEGLVIGYDFQEGLTAISTQQLINDKLLALVSGDIKANNLIAQDISSSFPQVIIGSTYPISTSFREERYLQIGRNSLDEDLAYGIHMIDGRASIDLNGTGSFRDFVLDYSDGSGNFGLARIKVRGNLEVTNQASSMYLTVGQPVVDTSYNLYVNGNARVEDTLTVREIKFIGTSLSPELGDIAAPQNVDVYYLERKEVVNLTQNLRKKDFSLTRSVTFNNNLKFEPPSDHNNDKDSYEKIIDIDGSSDSGSGEFNFGFEKDTMSYPEWLFTEDTNSTFLNADEISETTTNEELKRYSLGRITLATLGTLQIEWTGLRNNVNQLTDVSSVIQSYKLNSPYLRDKLFSNTIDWYPEENRFLDENMLVHVKCSAIDSMRIPAFPQMYFLNKPLWIYIPLSKWKFFRMTNELNENFDTYTIYYPFVNVLEGLNLHSFDRTGELVNEGKNWRIAIYPRFISQTLNAISVSGERLYSGEWSLDVVMFPGQAEDGEDSYAQISNVIGNLYIPYIEPPQT